LSVPGSGISDRSYRPDIDGIRAIAILSVLCYHGGVPGVTGGFTGVDIFFVISGYLIGGHIFSEVRAGRFSFMRFYQRRAKRILPAFYGVLIFTIVAALLLLSPVEANEFGRSAFGATLSASNIVFWRFASYFTPASDLNPLLMTWSLGVEEQFYAVIPLLMVLLAYIRRSLVLPAIVIVCTLSFLLAWAQLAAHPTMVFYLLPTRAWELGAGVILAVLELSRKRPAFSATFAQLVSFAGLVMMVVPMFLLTVKSQFPGVAALPSVLGTSLVMAMPGSWFNRRLLSLPPLVFVGRISYSLYLWHWPLLAYLRVISGDKLPQSAAYIAIAASFVFAVLSYYLIEQPFRNSTLRPAPLLIRYAIFSVFILAACGAIWASKGIPQRFPQLDKIDRAATFQLRGNPCLAEHGTLPPMALCDSTADRRPAIAIWGDSHSAALAPGLREIANSQNYSFIQLGHSDCMPLIGTAIFQPNLPMEAGECIKFNEWAVHEFETDPRVKIVVLAGQWAHMFETGSRDSWPIADTAHEHEVLSPDAVSALFNKSLAASIQGLQQAGKQVVVMEDVPTFDFDPIMKVRTQQIPVRHSLAQWMGFQSASDPGYGPMANVSSDAEANSHLKAAMEGLKGVQLVDLKPELCRDSNSCVYRDESHVFYADHHHIDVEGARYALRNFHFPAIAEINR
jgi:peptidoglycan/LPS O-acetylase OafA/YrhL